MPTIRLAPGAAMRPPFPFMGPAGATSILRKDLVPERRARLVFDELDVPAGRLLAVDRERGVVHALEADEVGVLGVRDRAEALEIGLPQLLSRLQVEGHNRAATAH